MRTHHQRKKIEVAGTCIENGGLRNSKSCYTVRTERLYKRKPGGPRKNWMDIIRRDLEDMDTTWDKPTNQRQTASRMASTCGPTRMRDDL